MNRERVQSTRSGSGRRGSSKRVPTTPEVLEELFQLLEDYGPAWYTEKHHNRAVAALRGVTQAKPAKSKTRNRDV